MPAPSKEFLDLLADIFQVLEKADSETSILKNDIPQNFFEPEPLSILDSLEKVTSGSKTTVLAKYKSKKYLTFYQIYHDIKVSSSLTIKNLKLGSKDYKNVDFFYKFSTELLMRESSLYNAALLEFNDLKPSELEEQVNNDFKKIGYSYTAGNGEIITYMASVPNPAHSAFSYNVFGQPPRQQPEEIKQPLFTSSIGKSDLDTRLTLVPEPYSLSKIIPIPKNNGATSSTFESLNTQISKIPLPTSAPTTILDNILHINWYIIQSPEWLDYEGKVLKPNVSSNLFNNNSKEPFRLAKGAAESLKSFAPLIDSKGLGVSSALKNKVWLNQVGLEEIDNIRKKYLGIKETSKSEDKEEKKTNGVVENKEEEEHTADYNPSKTIDVEKLLRWDPEEAAVLASIKKDKDQLATPKSFQKLITKEILELNKLRQKRFAKSDVQNVSPTTEEERILYKKITKLIAIAIKLFDIKPSSLPLEFSKKIPVLLSDYYGTLPSAPIAKSRATRLANIRGNYKKRTR